MAGAHTFIPSVLSSTQLTVALDYARCLYLLVMQAAKKGPTCTTGSDGTCMVDLKSYIQGGWV